MSVNIRDMRLSEQEATYQNAISTTKEDDLARTRILLDEVTMAPHVIEPVPMSAHPHTTHRPQSDRRLLSETRHGSIGRHTARNTRPYTSSSPPLPQAKTYTAY